MDLSIADSGMPLRVQLSGEIQSGDADRLIGQLENAKPKNILFQLEGKAPASVFDPRQWLWVDVESPGGDVEESLKLGRYLRSANALITTSQCTSACVFLLAGAVERVGLGTAAGHIGVHRPFFTDARGKSRSSLDEYFSDLHKELTDYLQEMHVPVLLADTMFAVPPEDMRMLSADELSIYFPQKDPAWDELTVARRATYIGVSSLSYRIQEVREIQDCAAAKTVMARDLSNMADCPSAGTFAVPIDNFAAYGLLFSGHCAREPDMFVRSGNADFMSCLPN